MSVLATQRSISASHKNRLHQLGKHLLCVTAITAATIFLYKTLIDRHGFDSHDLVNLYLRTQQTARLFLAGHFPPQVFPDAVYGAGHAFPQFYAPFSYWISAAIMLLIGDCMLSVNLSVLLSVLLSGLTLYFMVVVLTSDKLIALASAFLYISFPYRFVDIFVRGAIAESWTFVWYPLIFAGILVVITRRILPWYLPVGIGGLLLSHNLMPLYFLPLCAVLGLLALYWNGWRSTWMLLLGAVLGLGISLWFILPSQYYMPKMWISANDAVWADSNHVYDHRVLIEQFFYSSSKNWFGISGTIGLEDDSMSFELGIGQLILLPLVFFFFGNFEKLRKQVDSRLLIIGTVTFLGWLLALAFMIYPHIFLKILPKQFAYIQFPWRVLAISAFLAASTIAIFSHCLKSYRAIKYLLVSASVLILILVPGYQREKKVKKEWTNEILTEDYLRSNSKTGFMLFADFLPKEFDRDTLEKTTIDPAMAKKGMLGDPQVDGDATILNWRRDGSTITADLEVRAETRIVFPLMFYDFYRGESDGSKPLNLYSTRGQFGPFSTGGLTGMTVSPGTRTIRIYETLTTQSKIGILLAILSAMGIILSDIISRRHKEKL